MLYELDQTFLQDEDEEKKPPGNAKYFAGCVYSAVSLSTVHLNVATVLMMVRKCFLKEHGVPTYCLFPCILQCILPPSQTSQRCYQNDCTTHVV